jgi:hypothetical protein
VVTLHGAFAADNADAIYHGGSILTINDAQPRAEAVAVKDGKVLTVGSKEEVMKTHRRACATSQPRAGDVGHHREPCDP